MAKHNTLYDKSPKLERNEEGAVAVSKGEDKPAEGVEDKADPHEEERNSLFKRHEEEQSSMHERHKKDMKEMHKRHTASKEAPEAETKTEDKE